MKTIGQGWWNEPLRHSLARKGIKTRILAPKKSREYYAEDLSQKELNALQEQELKALKEGRKFTSNDYIKHRNNRLIKQYEERYELLSKGSIKRVEKETSFFINPANDKIEEYEGSEARSELENYRRDKADYLQYLDEKSKIDEFNKEYASAGYDKEKNYLKAQALTNNILKEIKNENPNVYDEIIKRKDYKLYVLDETDFSPVVKNLTGEEVNYSVNGVTNHRVKAIFIKTKIDYPNATSRAVLKEVIVHEYSHVKNREESYQNIKNEFRNTVKPVLKEEFKLLKNRILGRISKQEFNEKKKILDYRLSRATIGKDFTSESGYEGFEYPAYHSQWRYRRKLKKTYYDKVLELEGKGDFSLPNYRANDNKIFFDYIGNKESDI